LGLWTGLKDKLEKGLETTSQRSKKVLDISRISLLLRSTKENEEDLYRRLGREIYRYWERKQQLELTDLTRATLNQIREVREKIAEMEETLEQLKKEEKERSSEWKEEAEQIPVSTDEESKAVQEASEEEKGKEPMLGSRSRRSNRSLEKADEQPKTSSNGWVEGEAIFICPHCGDRVEEDTVFCPHCHKHVYHD